MTSKSAKFDYSGRTRGTHKHDFQSTGETELVDVVDMGACATVAIPVVKCTKCGLNKMWRHVNYDDCPVA